LLDDGLTPRDLLKACGIDPSVLDWVGKNFNTDEPRIPVGNRIESGEWTSDYGSGVTPVAARQIPDEYRTGDPDKFFDSLYGPVHALAQRLGIDETWLLGLAAHESGYLDPHDRELNDPFGVTHGGGQTGRKSGDFDECPLAYKMDGLPLAHPGSLRADADTECTTISKY
jgi:hypothetical protein